MRLFLASKLVEVVDEHFDLGRAGPVLHLDPVDDAALLDVLFVLLDVGLVPVDGERNVACWAVGVTACTLEGLDVVLRALSAELVLALRSDSLFCWFIANAADEDILTTFGMSS